LFSVSVEERKEKKNKSQDPFVEVQCHLNTAVPLEKRKTVIKVHDGKKRERNSDGRVNTTSNGS
jgi:hypothetical protein